jgi:hypothetical protein
MHSSDIERLTTWQAAGASSATASLISIQHDAAKLLRPQGTRLSLAATSGTGHLRRAARQSKSVRFTALLHHITTDLLKQSYLSLERDSAPGIDGVTWQAYGEKTSKGS